MGSHIQKLAAIVQTTMKGQRKGKKAISKYDGNMGHFIFTCVEIDKEESDNENWLLLFIVSDYLDYLL